MSLVERMVYGRVKELLNELEVISIELVTDTYKKKNSVKIADLTTMGEIPKEKLLMIGTIHLQLKLLKGMI